MKKISVVLPALVLGIAALAQAQAPAGAAPPSAAPAGGPTKVAIINVQTAVLSTADGKKATADLTAKFTPKRSVLEKKGADIQTMQDQLRKGSATLSEDAKAKLNRDIESNQKSLQRDSEDFDADVQQEENKIMNDLGEKMMQILIKYCQQNAISLVVNVADPQSPVLWADQSIDITQEIVRLYDQAHPPQVGTTPAPGAAKPPAAPPVKPPATPPTQKKQ